MKLIAVNIIFLVVTLPMSSSLVNAAFIRKSEVYGNDEIMNFAKDDDTKDDVTLHVIVDTGDVLDAEVTPDEISVKIPEMSSSFTFADPICKVKSCSLITGNPEYGLIPYDCICETSWAPDNYLELIFEYRDSGDVSSAMTSTIPLYVDNTPPKVHAKSKVEMIDSKLQLDYSVEDFSCSDSSCNGKCVGIGELTLYDDIGKIQTIEIESEDCLVEDNVEIEYNKDGVHQFYLEAKDKMWRSTDDENHISESKISEIETDFSSPTVSSDFSVEFNNKPIEYIGNNGVKGVDISFVFEDDNPYSMTMKLSQLGDNSDIINLEIPIDEIGGKVNCNTIEDGKFNCTIFNVNIDDKDASFDITIVDEMGNKIETTLGHQFTLDSTNPVVSYFGNDLGTTYLKEKDNTIMAIIEEDDSGFFADNIFLDARALGYPNLIKPNECIKENTWKCTWENIDNMQAGNSAILFLHQSSTDDAGNPLEGELQKNFVMDNTVPELDDITINAITGQGLLEFIKLDDKLLIIANLTDDSGILSGVVNFSELIDETQENLTGVCKENSLGYGCVWETPNIEVLDYTRTNLNFEFTDLAGNVLEVSEKIKIHKISTDEPDCFSLKINTDHIAPIERQIVGSLVEGLYFQYVPFRLEQKACGDDLKLYNMELYCDGAILSYSNLQGSNNYQGFINFVLNSADIASMKEEEFIAIGEESNCTLVFYDVSNRYAYEEPELENIVLHIPLTNDLETPDEAIKKDVKSVISEYDKYRKKYDGIVEIVESLNKICRIPTLLSQIENTLEGVEISLCALGKVGIIAPITEPLRIAVVNINGVLKFIHTGLLGSDYIAYPCAFVQCSGGYAKIAGNELFVIPGGLLTPLKKLLESLSGKIKLDIVKNAGDLFKQIPSEYEMAKSSKLAAYAGLCLPGILYHSRVDIEMKCMKSLCYYEAVPNGFPKQECEKIYDYEKCVRQYGPVSILIEIIGIKYIVDYIVDFLTNPVLIAYQLTKFYLGTTCVIQESKDQSCGLPGARNACKLYYAWNAIEKTLTLVNQGKQLFNYVKGIFDKQDPSNSDVPNYCDQLKESVEKR